MTVLTRIGRNASEAGATFQREVPKEMVPGAGVPLDGVDAEERDPGRARARSPSPLISRLNVTSPYRCGSARGPIAHVSSIVMDFLVYSRSAPAAGDSGDDPGLDEQHWSYMDGFADRMTARGPTLGPDRQTWTGSLHVVDLRDSGAAREFVAREPYNRAGLFEEHFIWRFTNFLGRTMWQFAGATDEPRFLVLAQAADGLPHDRTPAPLAALPRELRERLIVYGELRNLDQEEPAGVVLAVQVPTREALDALLGDGRAGLVDFGEVRIHDWEFGGRR